MRRVGPFRQCALFSFVQTLLSIEQSTQPLTIASFLGRLFGYYFLCAGQDPLCESTKAESTKRKKAQTTHIGILTA